MNGIHDMGGMHGFGPIQREEHEPVFHHPWEGRLFAMRMATSALIPVPGGFRYAIERMDPAHYLVSSYYEKWLHVSIGAMIHAGVLSHDELEARIAFLRENPHAPLPRREDPVRVQQVVATQIRAPESLRHDVEIHPQFRIGDTVRARHAHPAGHTRLPGYARGKRGVVARFYGIQDFPDTRPPGTPAAPQPLYSVRFEAEELWGESAEPNGAVYLDMWEQYLAPA